ncbi:hypothetical protein HN51_000676 [Arachis hypogaea]|uniref:DNA-directed DNA polymerase n=2 Tax=Arachis TaxID=3817 RepID=A0A6P4CP16_ARADU|nr:DNA polymerase I A, chloroplastic/mitochondrial [Arachis duranensis]XP_025693460.1 DNA polymerase I A, chloroplastic/mitochondrial [Arachis hypogaea]XP_052116714.1 DNA polymerase I A, chloroplastic/mitochondrial [Arachis duranensis]QHO48651.1 DNA polymerase I A/mitochondrial [Arachis hypogaea]RYR79267.1 hypothetical protein Ahy_A01g004100 [Arachis hypogaea]
MAMGLSTHRTPLIRPYCPSCFRVALSFFASQSHHNRRKNNILQISTAYRNSLKDSYCKKRGNFGSNKCNSMEYNHKFLHKIPVNISSRKFSTASTAGLASWNPRLSGISADSKICSRSRKAWEEATNKIQESKMICNGLNRFHQSNSSYESNTLSSNDFEAIPKNLRCNIELQGRGGPASPSVLNNSNVFVENEEFCTQSFVSSLDTAEAAVPIINGNHGLDTTAKAAANTTSTIQEYRTTKSKLKDKLCSIYEDILVVDNISLAEKVAKMLTVNYRHLIHACDTEVAKIDVKQETPVDHGEIICFSIYSGPEADFGGGKSCIWVDVLDGGGQEIFDKFAKFFKDPSIKKVWHNYSFDCHVIENYGFKVSGFYADTMHMARLWDSSRRWVGGYSLEALTGDREVMSRTMLTCEKDLIGKVSMKTIFGQKKVKKDGSEGKIVNIAPVEVLQRDERIPWICYSSLDARSTLKLYESLKNHLLDMPWKFDGVRVSNKTMYDFYKEYWQPFGELLVKMESEGVLVDQFHLQEIEKVAKAQQEAAVNRFRKWASRYCPDAKYMNVGSDVQLRILLFGGTVNRRNHDEMIPTERIFKIPNVDKVIEEGKKAPTKYRDIKLTSIGYPLRTEMYTSSGWPSVSGDALKVLAGKVSAEYDFDDFDDDCDLELDDDFRNSCQTEVKPVEIEKSAYGTALAAFPTMEEGREACHAIASLCEVCSIDSLISNFILPLQGCNILGKDHRIHCSININTETGRLSARRPSLQNQPALEKDRYKIRQAFIAAPGNSLIVADYGQLELRILAHLANCKSMLEAFEAGGDFHSRTAMNMYPYICDAVNEKQVLLEWHPQPGEDKPPVPLLKDAFASERRKAKMLNFSIAYGKTPIGLSKDWKVSVKEAKKTVDLWYNDRKEVLKWQEERKKEALESSCVYTLLGRCRRFPSVDQATNYQKGHIERAAINTPVQGSAADVAMCAMLQIWNNEQLKDLGWKLLLQVHDEVILEGPTESAEVAKAIVVECMSKPFNGKNILKVGLSVDAKCAQNWYAGK